MDEAQNSQGTVLCGIYALRNENSQSSEYGMMYIGQSSNIHKRLEEHYRNFKNNLNPHLKLYKGIRGGGVDNFRHYILELCNPSELNDREIYWISYYNSQMAGYNMEPGGCWVRGVGSPRAVLNDFQLKRILYLLSHTKRSIADIAREFGLVYQIVSAINNGLTYREDNTSYPIRKNKTYITTCIECGSKIKWSSKYCKACSHRNRKKNEIYPSNIGVKQVSEIKELLKNSDKSFKEIAECFDRCSVGMVYSINAGQTWSDVGNYHYPLRISDEIQTFCEDCGVRIRSDCKRCGECHGKRIEGEGNPKAKLTERDVRDIRLSLRQNISMDDLAKKFRVSKSTIKDIRYNKTWKNVKI